jgi:7,8-dihydropterin-6-yl-methyl-4-(beta-D-ribofuranosyl)aminobenzene 5'-phosphate synthase
LKAFGVQQFVGAHCTGIEATYRIRQLAGLTRQTAMVGAVGASYSLSKGIDAGQVAK